MLYAIGTSPYNLVNIGKCNIISAIDESYYHIFVDYGIIQSDCTLFNNKCDAEKILKDMKDENNIVTFTNRNIFAGILDKLDEPEPKIEDLKIYRLNVEEAE